MLHTGVPTNLSYSHFDDVKYFNPWRVESQFHIKTAFFKTKNPHKAQARRQFPPTPFLMAQRQQDICHCYATYKCEFG